MPGAIERAVPPQTQQAEQPGFWRSTWNHAVHMAPDKAETIGHAAFITFNAGFAGYEIYKMTQPKRSMKQQIWAGVQIAFSLLFGAFDARRLYMAHKQHQARKNGEPLPYPEPQPKTYDATTVRGIR